MSLSAPLTIIKLIMLCVVQGCTTYGGGFVTCTIRTLHLWPSTALQELAGTVTGLLRVDAETDKVALGAE